MIERFAMSIPFGGEPDAAPVIYTYEGEDGEWLLYSREDTDKCFTISRNTLDEFIRKGIIKVLTTDSDGGNADE